MPAWSRGRPWVPHLVLVVGWLAVLPLVGHYGNPDGPSYVTVAARWVQLDLPAAVNAYWGPLLSWLSAPLVGVGIPGLFALRLVLLVGALLTLAPLRHLCRRAGAGHDATETVLVAVAAFLVYASSFGLYADVLMCAALLRSLELLTRPAALADVSVAARAGAWAGVAFLARAYALPVALLSVPLVAALAWWTVTRTGPDVALRGIGRSVGAAVAGVVVVAGAWAGVLSLTYGEPTFSTSAGFNTELVAPGSAGNPFNVRGLHEPTRPDSVSAWEEPSQLPVPVRSDAPGGEVGSPGLGDRLGLAVANARIVVGSVLRRGAPFAVLALVALIGWARRREVPPAAVTGPLLAGAIAAGGLLLVIAIERYLWFPILATVPAAAVGLDQLSAWWPRWRTALVAGLVVVVAATSLHGLLPRIGAHAEVTAAARTLDGGELDGRVAAAGSWQRSHLLCFRVGCQYLGRPEAQEAGPLLDELRAADVDHLLVWATDADRIEGLVVEPDVALTVLTVTEEGLQPTRQLTAEELR